MPIIYLPVDELKAIQDVLHHRPRVDWAAYDRGMMRLKAAPLTDHAEGDAPRLRLGEPDDVNQNILTKAIELP